MKCPMTFNSLYADVDEKCRADCAWLLEKTGKNGKTVLMCAIAMIGRKQMHDGRGAECTVVETRITCVLSGMTLEEVAGE